MAYSLQCTAMTSCSKMDEEHAARVKEMDARMEESRKAADLRRKEAQERFECSHETNCRLTSGLQTRPVRKY